MLAFSLIKCVYQIKFNIALNVQKVAICVMIVMANTLFHQIISVALNALKLNAHKPMMFVLIISY